VLAFDDWRMGFVWSFPISLLWILLWMKQMKKPSEHKKVNQAELDYILSDTQPEATEEKMRWKDILPQKGAWVIALAKFMADPIWWFYLFWGAKFLYSRFGVELKQIGLPFFSIYLLSWLIGIFLGWLSSWFLKRGMGINRGRKLGLLFCALFAIPVMLVPHTENLHNAVLLIALAAGGHCGWSANVFSLMSDLFPKNATASVAGFGGFSGAIGGALVAFMVGRILQHTGSEGYDIPFAIAGMGYLVALGLMHLILPVFKPVELHQSSKMGK
jgi:ACS family hexuronate transporter-like MFS transporter